MLSLCGAPGGSGCTAAAIIYIFVGHHVNAWHRWAALLSYAAMLADSLPGQCTVLPEGGMVFTHPSCTA